MHTPKLEQHHGLEKYFREPVAYFAPASVVTAKTFP